MKSKFHKLGILLILASTPILRAADRSDRIRELSQNFMCVCGCNQLLGACNHFHCPSSGPMMSELAKLVDQAKTDDQITAYFVDKYGSTVLAAPPVSGFNLAAWITPFAALAIGALLAVYFLRQYRTRWAGAPEANQDLAKYQDKVEEELKTFIPED